LFYENTEQHMFLDNFPVWKCMDHITIIAPKWGKLNVLYFYDFTTIFITQDSISAVWSAKIYCEELSLTLIRLARARKNFSTYM